MNLHYRKIGEGYPTYILHGVFGSSDNWQTVGKMLSEHLEVYLIDQRNHGNSPHSDLFNYEAMANDLIELMNDLNHEKVNIIGHSMGGKVAMEFATTHPEKVNKLVVVDIAPKYYPPHHQEVLAGFKSVRLKEIKSRGEAEEDMSAVIKDFGIRQFLLKNLKRDSDGFKWKINLQTIEENIENVGVGLENSKTYNGDTLFIAGSKSKYIADEDQTIISRHFPQNRIITIEGAGHWVHAEKPRELFDEVLKFLS